MNKTSRLLFYLLLNILISAAVTLTVLWIWDLQHPYPEDTANLTGISSEQTGLSQSDQASSDSLDKTDNSTIAFINENIDLDIYAIVGAGNLEVEYVEIRNQSQGPIDLTGWQLIDDTSQTFTFPALILNSDGAIKVLSKQGVNTVIELYWQSDSPIWQSGETARLLNAAGETITTYAIP